MTIRSRCWRVRHVFSWSASVRVNRLLLLLAFLFLLAALRLFLFASFIARVIFRNRLKLFNLRSSLSEWTLVKLHLLGSDDRTDKVHKCTVVLWYMVKSVEYLLIQLLDIGRIWFSTSLFCNESNHLVADGLWVVACDHDLLTILQLGILLLYLARFLLLLVLVPVARVDKNGAIFGSDGVARET